MKKARKSFGTGLQALRLAAGLSQAELAQAAGVPVSTLQNWEIDRTHPARQLVGVLGVLSAALGAERLAELWG